ncbi:hypothetical protein B0A55_00423 [Friedmanniomyces simplex]|uniref:RING-type domain-containing protein n=1 Tax=Friedmanniomyces simplex TaxID=329884 RepID=A0A4U0Y523_9PEZI|nr:hypothetical protein B0A55_00423 [Friedmanniomyces simplex]
MTARAMPFASQPDVIDLMSDDGDLDMPASPGRTPLELDANGDLSPLDENPFLPFDFFGGPADDADIAPLDPAAEAPLRGEFVRIDGEDVWIPDEDDEPAMAGPHDAAVAAAMHEEQAAPRVELDADGILALAMNEEFTVDTCLQRVLEIFPDISHEYVHRLYSAFDETGDYETLSGPARLDNIIEQLVSGTSYPKQEKGKQPMRKRKRKDSIDDADITQWERQDRVPMPRFVKSPMQAMLKAEYPEIPVHYIHSLLVLEKHFFQAFVRLANIKDGRDPTIRFGRGRPAKNIADADTIATNSHWPPLTDELNAARKRVQFTRAQRAAEDARKMAEEENLQQAKERGETSECSCCFDELPLNRQIHCDGPVAHLTCFDCAETYVKTEVGESRCRVLCTAGCGAPFAPNQLNLLSDKQLLEKLAELEQEKAIRDAGLEDLEECPFCDYKAIVPPVDEDFEFRCANPECEKISCRRCKSTSHIPISCEQHAKNNKVNSRHKIEEAMTAAMIRSCNKCKKQFIKDYGCNKMACPSCGSLQCYVCSASIRDYNHFDQAPGRALSGATAKQCPLYDNVEERHEREVKEAEAAARAQVMQDNPDVQPDDLEFKVSDAVKKATADRIKKAGGVGGFGMGGGGGHDGAADGDEDDEDDLDGDEAPAVFRARATAAHRRALARRQHETVATVNAARMAIARRAVVHPSQQQPPPPVQPRGPAAQADQPVPQGFIPVYDFQQAAAQQPHGGGGGPPRRPRDPAEEPRREQLWDAAPLAYAARARPVPREPLAAGVAAQLREVMLQARRAAPPVPRFGLWGPDPRLAGDVFPATVGEGEGDGGGGGGGHPQIAPPDFLAAGDPRRDHQQQQGEAALGERRQRDMLMQQRLRLVQLRARQQQQLQLQQRRIALMMEGDMQEGVQGVYPFGMGRGRQQEQGRGG